MFRILPVSTDRECRNISGQYHALGRTITQGCSHLTKIMVINIEGQDDMERLSVLPELFEGNPPVTRHKGPVMQSLDNPFVGSMNKLLNKRSSRRWFETLWRLCNVSIVVNCISLITRLPKYDDKGNIIMGICPQAKTKASLIVKVRLLNATHFLIRLWI